MKLLKTQLGLPGFNFLDTNGQHNGLDYGFALLWNNSTIDGYWKMQNLKSRLNSMLLRNLINYCHAQLDNGPWPSIAEPYAYVDVRGNHAK